MQRVDGAPGLEVPSLPQGCYLHTEKILATRATMDRRRAARANGHKAATTGLSGDRSNFCQQSAWITSIRPVSLSRA